MKTPLRLYVVLIAIPLLFTALCSTSGAQTSGFDSSHATADTPSTSQLQANPIPAPTSLREATIPGPLRSFLRMAGISQKASADEVLPILAQEIDERGYVSGRPTEFLVLVKRYLQQARELETLAGPGGVIRVSNCEEAKPLLQILGYRLQQGCGPNTTVQTDDPGRAFLTIDSGFPLVELEETLRGGKPFVLPYPSSHVPLLFTQSDWMASDTSGNAKEAKDVIDIMLGNLSLARLYSALGQMDAETAIALKQSPGLSRLVNFSNVLDFYGSHLYIRSGRVIVPGGSATEPAWKELVGAGPDEPGEFVAKLLAKDQGWLAAYFDALSRVSQSQQAYFASPERLKIFYTALRGQDVSPGPAKPVFRPDPSFSILVTRLQLDSNGQPLVPGGLEAWMAIFRHNSKSKRGHEWARRAGHWTNPEHLVDGLVGLSREFDTDGPLQIYLMLSEIDRGRTPEERLNAETVRLLADKFPRFGDQYPVFSEFHTLSNASIASFLKSAEALDRISYPTVRANAIGIFQANLGLWQILARQGQIPTANLNDSWQKIISPFAGVTSSPELFDAGRTSFGEVLRAATGRTDLSEDEVVDLLAGPDQASTESQQVHQELVRRIRGVLDAQRLVSLDTLFALGSGLNEMAKGKAVGDTLIPLAGELREFEMPRPIFTEGERAEFEHELSDTRHATLQTRTNLAKIIKSGSPKELSEARGRLTAFLRDTLVGMNYAYYEPPGAQMLRNNALFVRSHDYASEFGTGGEQPWKTPRLVSNDGTHLAGSLADLPYALAWVEQDFIVPENVQSLIWEDLAPSLLTSAVVPRWWGVTPNELHAVTLYQRTGEELLTSAAQNEKLRQMVMNILADRMLPQRAGQVEKTLRAGHAEQALPQVMPAETFYLAVEFRRKFPNETGYWGAAGKELDSLSHQAPTEVSWQRLSDDFGVPHPALARSYSRELLNVKPFPTFQDYSSRLLAESWDSSNLYWARLADEQGYPPVMLNRLVPELTHRMVEKIFASNLEDWPAVLRAMQETGDEFRKGKIAALLKVETPAAH
ncbi:MAG TPA: hypothetical protein VK699_00690 [Terriglobales bacterium]|jgi:hypothetical protein|nr:hypothetical protein [Terriglobales bacterium]